MGNLTEKKCHRSSSGGIFLSTAQRGRATTCSTSCDCGSCSGSGWSDRACCWSDRVCCWSGCGYHRNVPGSGSCRSTGSGWYSSGFLLMISAGGSTLPCVPMPSARTWSVKLRRVRPSCRLSGTSSCWSSFRGPSRSSCRRHFPCSLWPRLAAPLLLGQHRASHNLLRSARLAAFVCWCKRTYPRVA